MSAVLMLRPEETASLELSVASTKQFEGTVKIEESANQQAWKPGVDVDGIALSYTYALGAEKTAGDIVVTTIKNVTRAPRYYRVSAPVVAQDPVVYSLIESATDTIAVVLRDHLNRPLLGVREDGSIVALAKLWTPSGVGAADGDLQVADVTISAADIVATTSGKFGHANGYPLVAPVGADSAPLFLAAALMYDRDTATFGAGGNITVNLSGGGAAQSGLVSAANSVGAGTDKAVGFYPLSTAGVPLVANAGLNLVASGAFTNPGTAAGVVRVRVWYRVVALAFVP